MKLKISSDNGIVELTMTDESAKTVALAQCEVLHFCEQITNMFDKVVCDKRAQITDIELDLSRSKNITTERIFLAFVYGYFIGQDLKIVHV